MLAAEELPDAPLCYKLHSIHHGVGQCTNQVAGAAGGAGALRVKLRALLVLAAEELPDAPLYCNRHSIHHGIGHGTNQVAGAAGGA